MSALDREIHRRRMAGFIKVGAQVHYHPIINEQHDGRVYIVRDVDIEQGRVWLEGKSGFVIVDAVSSADASGEG
ncbi:hypothetical protein LJR143_001660 [Pseudoxanthomonas sp. LjRoot143]|uniref:hypothetical protein n=1 Tax=Pseudoxanthomonas sp. LjRoot143 TaxID=3342266 RepID=UPI003ECC313C